MNIIYDSNEKRLSIAINDDDLNQFKADLSEFENDRPNATLKTVELERAKGSSINMQGVLDEVYKVIYKKKKEKKTPVTIKISSELAEDFDLNFSDDSQVDSNETYTNGGFKQNIELNNKSDSSIKIPSLKGKFPNDANELILNGFDLENLDITDANFKKISVKSNLTKNASKIKGIKTIPGLGIENIPDDEFNSIYEDVIAQNSSMHKIVITLQNLHDRKILEELSVNPNLTNVSVFLSNVNNLDGLENFDGRISFLGLSGNNLTTDDLVRLNKFWDNNPFLDLYAYNNTEIRADIRNDLISRESFEIIRDCFEKSGTIDTKKGMGITNRIEAVDRLTWSSPDIPYYIKDAKIIRGDLKITKNPMMIENDSEIDTIDFNQDYLKDGTLLLTIPQIEKVLASGQSIPQDIRIKIHDVSELSSQEVKDLQKKLTGVGMNLSSVQMFDENGDNNHWQIAPYPLSKYVYIRDTLDLVADGIDASEPDLDKFTTIYQRLKDNIVYDEEAMKSGNSEEDLYLAEKRFSSRNLLEGLEEGKCVCSGYSDILRNALSLVGIESRVNGGLAWEDDPNSGHAWNQVKINGKWYYTDLTWDAGKNNYDETLLGEKNFTNNRHEYTTTQDIETVEEEDFDRAKLEESLQKARKRSISIFPHIDEITTPEDSRIETDIFDSERINEEYQKRKNDMYAKYYGNKNYQKNLPALGKFGRFRGAIHRLMSGEKDESPYKNSFYHRLAARKNYFQELHSNNTPNQPVRNFIRSRWDAVFKSKEGNEGVLEAGAAAIRKNIENEEKQKNIEPIQGETKVKKSQTAKTNPYKNSLKVDTSELVPAFNKDNSKEVHTSEKGEKGR